MGNRNSSKSKVPGRMTRVASTEPGYEYDYEPMGMPVAKFRDEYKGKSNMKGQHGIGVYSENTHLEKDETFNSFIRSAKCKIRTVSHIDREESNVTPAPPPDYETNPRENQDNQFSNFIQSTKKKLRTTSSIRKNNGSFKRGY